MGAPQPLVGVGTAHRTDVRGCDKSFDAAWSFRLGQGYTTRVPSARVHHYIDPATVL